MISLLITIMHLLEGSRERVVFEGHLLGLGRTVGRALLDHFGQPGTHAIVYFTL